MANKNTVDQLQSTLEDLFKKAPALPPNAVDVLFKISPWIALIFGILGLVTGLAGFGALTFLAPFAVMGGVSNYGFGFVAAIGLLVSSVLMLIAFPGLKAGKTGGWNLLFWSEVVNVISSLVGFNFINAIIGALIGFYLLYQIKPKFK